MSHPSFWSTFGQALPGYLAEPSTGIAVLLPLVLCAGLSLRAPPRPFPPFPGAWFLAGTALSVVFSVFRTTELGAELLMLPGYALLCVLAPARWRPGPAHAYVLCFASLLCADLWGAAVHQIGPAGLDPEFYVGVGGAGAGDQLFLVPPLLVVLLLVQRALEATTWAHVPVGRLVTRRWNRSGTRS